MCECQMRKNINEALLNAQDDFNAIEATQTNNQYKSKYARLPDITVAVRPALKKNGLLLRHYQAFHPVTHVLTEITMLEHVKSGEFYMDTRYVVSEKPGNQGLGGAETYMRKYAISAILGVAIGEEKDKDCQEEDDYIEQRKRMVALLKKAVDEAMPNPKEFHAFVHNKYGVTSFDGFTPEQIVEVFYLVVNNLKPKRN